MAQLGGALMGLLALGLSAVPAGTEPLSHGMWVTRTVDLLNQDPNADSLLGFSMAFGISEVYLAVGSNALTDVRLPNFVAHVKDRGLRVEALIDCSGRSECQMGTWSTRIQQVKDYNQGRPGDQSFDGVHLDLEPWVGTGDDYSWVPDLISYYQQASSALEGSGLTLAADVSGTKVTNDQVQPADRQALLDAATRLVLLEFVVSSVDQVFQRVDAFRNTVDLSNAFFLVATRVVDFGASNNCQNRCVLDQIEGQYAGTFGYAGWATFRYIDYNDPSICPGDCCLVCTPPAAGFDPAVVAGRRAIRCSAPRRLWNPQSDTRF